MTISTEELHDMAKMKGIGTADGLLADLATELLAARAKLEAAEKLAEAAKALDVRHLVAGWNGEGRDTPYTPHPDGLSASIWTTAGTVYALDTAIHAWEAAQ